MKTDTQQLIIIILGVIAIICILKDYDHYVIATTIGILGGFLTGKKMSEKEEETLEQYYIQKAEQQTLKQEGEVDVQ